MAATYTPSLLPKLNPPPLHHTTTTTTAAAAITTTRRSSLILAASASALFLFTKPATAFDFRMTVPDQTVEEAESGIQPHAQSLLGVKDLLMAESWKEAQKLLRKSSSLLKQDIYTIIQAKPAEERPRLRKLYSDLFNGVTKLDYAARDEDRIAVWECYDRVVSSLAHILSRL
ncbi:hypothetical protein Salat_1538500 [Sesamum alatum]|uniref:PsbQ-like protein 3, chloroplastic n=1 Tax=Sesamum alatum TaxID=300844 RepID=A0AAE1YCP7_9LAMI|nr:hypothetical protein Salat_1538500 [Sesamum alatum]